MSTKKNFDIYDGMNLMWSDNGEKTYMIAVRQDDVQFMSYEDFDFVSGIYCWHRRYKFGVNHNFSQQHDFWINAVEKCVPEEDQINYVLEGKISGVSLTTNGDGTYNMFFDEYPEFFYKKEPEWKILQDIQNELSDEDCANLLRPYVEWLPIWMYDHSGQTICCGEVNPFNDRFDSGQLGLVIVDKQTMISEFGCTEDNWRDKAREIMSAEVNEYNEFIQNNVFGYFLYEFVGEESSDLLDWDNWEEHDPAIWGFIGSNIYENGMMESIGCGLQEAIESERYDEVPDFEVSIL